jgi:penicillin-insensitive murein endopeptidase
MDWEAFDSTSLRNPNDGSLEGGVPLPLSAPGLRFNPSRDPQARFGTLEVVRALVQAAQRVDRELGGLPVTVNDLSLERGGPIPHHRSHQSGRDVDVLFYQLDENGEPIESVGAFFDRAGKAVDFRDLADPSDDVPLRLDLPRTWLFLQALIEDGAAQLQNIYVAEHIRTLLLSYARKSGSPPEVVERFEALTCQPRYPHDDHFHFRFFCTAEDITAGCRDSAPIYPWQRALLRSAGVEPLPLAPKREGSAAKVVTHQEARKAAGPMDPEVERWLDRRQEWIAKPHPGRRYCR